MNTKHRDRVFLWMILPALAGFMLLFIVPTLMSFAYSITNWSVYNPELRIVGIKNFAQLFSDEKTMAAIGHSIKYAISVSYTHLDVYKRQDMSFTKFSHGI